MRLEQWVVDDAALYADLWASCDELRAPLVAADCEARLSRSLVRLLGDAVETPPVSRSVSDQPADRLTRLGEHLRTHVTESISLDQLAATAALSKFYLLRAFRRAYGFTPHAYQMQLRLARAWRLIVEGTPLTWAAYDAGFADQSHLTRRFTALFGLTPGSLARQLTPRTRLAHTVTDARREMFAPSAA
jgi:AraC-like DNA-binding protein